PATYNRLTTSADKNILAFERSAGGEKVVYIANLSKNPVEFNVKLDSELQPYLGKKDFKLAENGKYSFGPWEYVILQNK
ncbi:MAG: alpha-glucosidase C-terminal domain-containing protein, partial [Salinimicrobium sp.]